MSKTIVALNNDRLLSQNSLKEKGYILVGLSENKSYELTSSWTYNNVELDNIIKTNNVFSLEDNAIVIPSGVTRVRISGQVMTNGNAYRIIRILRNTSLLSELYQATSNGSTYYMSLTMSPIIFDVSEGDKIYLQYGSGNYNLGSTTMTFSASRNTYLLLEEFR